MVSPRAATKSVIGDIPYKCGSSNILFCSTSLCLPYGLHIDGRMYVLMRAMLRITSPNARMMVSCSAAGTCFECGESDGSVMSGAVGTTGEFEWDGVPELCATPAIDVVDDWVQAPLCNAKRSLLVELLLSRAADDEAVAPPDDMTLLIDIESFVLLWLPDEAGDARKND